MVLFAVENFTGVVSRGVKSVRCGGREHGSGVSHETKLVLRYWLLDMISLEPGRKIQGKLDNIVSFSKSWKVTGIVECRDDVVWWA